MCGEADGWMEYGVNHDAAPGVIRAGGLGRLPSNNKCYGEVPHRSRVGKGAGPLAGRRHLFTSVRWGRLDQPADSPAVHERHHDCEHCTGSHAAGANGKWLIDVEDPDPEHPADNRCESTQGGDNRCVARLFFRTLDDGLHEEPNGGSHDDPNPDADPVLHIVLPTLWVADSLMFLACRIYPKA